MPKAVTAAARLAVDPDYAGRGGYDPKFLGRTVPLPRLTVAQKRLAARLIGKRSALLRYHHFSLVMHARRRLPFFTAVNLDGLHRPKLPPRKDAWSFDPRLPRETQIDSAFYAGNDFDLGHLVRRLDPAWGDTPAEAIRANNDTFHLANCAPQHKLFNRSAQVWAGLEDYILDRARAAGLRACVFTGPVLREDDPELAGIAVPLEFWKVVVALTDSGRLSATAYVVSQAEQVRTMRLRAAPPFGAFKTYQVPLAGVEQRTGLNFGGLRRYDPLGRPGLRAAPPRALESHDQIML